MNDLIKLSDVEKRVIILRNQKVILDSDVAELYGVETKRINPDKEKNKIVVTLNGSTLTKSSGKLGDWILSAPTWLDEQYNEYVEGRKHFNNLLK